MRNHILALTVSTLALTCAVAPVMAESDSGGLLILRPAQPQPSGPDQQQSSDPANDQQQSSDTDGEDTTGQGGGGMQDRGGMMGHRGMMGGMMGRMMGRGRGEEAQHRVLMRMVFALVDTDSDGTLSLQEFQSAHERLFKAMDSNKDGVLSFEELEGFLHGGTAPQSR